MIKLCALPENYKATDTESIRIKLNSLLYGDLCGFWQDQNGNIISALSGDFTVDYCGENAPEIMEFLKISGAKTVFSSAGFFKAAKADFEEILVFETNKKYTQNQTSKELKSDEIYEILSSCGLFLPQKDYFSVDFCLRKNHGFLNYFAVENTAVALVQTVDNVAFVSAVASRKKGFGSTVLGGALSGADYTFALCAAKKELTPFYEKNGFKYKYTAGIWRNL